VARRRRTSIRTGRVGRQVIAGCKGGSASSMLDPPKDRAIPAKRSTALPTIERSTLRFPAHRSTAPAP
jgi:hypothetical protein